jgi:small-conductance mechanosensitive channel
VDALVAGLLLLSGQGACSGQTAPTNTPIASAPTKSEPIPLTELAVQAESAEAATQTMKADLAADQASRAVQEQLPILSADINARMEEDARLLAATPSLNLLRRMGEDWRRFQEQLNNWKKTLAKRGQELNSQSIRLTELDNTWTVTTHSAETSNVPAEILERGRIVLSTIQETLQKTRQQQVLVLTLQNRVTQQDARVGQAQSTIAHARRDAFAGLMSQDSPPLWSSRVWSHSAQKVASESQRSLARQTRALKAYVARMGERFALHTLIFLVIGILLALGRWRLRKEMALQPELKHAGVIFEMPIATALLLGFLASGWLYPESPRLFRALTGVAILLPAMVVLRRLIAPVLFPILYGLVLFYFADQVRLLLASQALLSRLVFLGEMLVAACFAGYTLRLLNVLSVSATGRKRIWIFVQATVWITLAAFTLAAITTFVGYCGLGKLIGHIVLTSAYLALVLYAAIRILDGMILSALSVPPLAHLDLIKHHRAFLQIRAWRLLQWVALIFWGAFLLEALSLRAPLFEDFKAISSTTVSLGTHRISIGDVLLFAVAVWLAFTVSKVCRFVLEEEVYPRVHLAPGLHYSINKVVHYAILIVGFFAGISLLGFDLSKLTILAGAFSVGLGFGLQNIINNFVSGIILLFERPIKIGDVIQIDANEGVVERIGIRASIVRTRNGSAIIMPNGKLISDPVTNWTFARQQRLIVLPIKVGAGADPQKISELLKAAALAHPLIAKEPSPEALVTDIAGGTLHFELRASTNATDKGSQIKSDLAAAIYSDLGRQKIAIA